MFVVVPMHAALLGVLIFVTEVMRVFGAELSKVQAENLNSDVVREAGVSGAITFPSPDLSLINVFVSIVIVLLTAANAFAPYASSGGHRYKLFAFATAMMVISGLTMLAIPPVVHGLL